MMTCPIESKAGAMERRGVNCLMVGTGEYTTGYSPTREHASDKNAGVVALTMFDLRRQGRVKKLGLCGVNGNKLPAIRNHMKKNISEVYKDMDCHVDTFPDDDQVDPNAYLKAATTCFGNGDAAIVFTPDDTHYQITMDLISHGMHVLTTKPLVRTLQEHKSLIQMAKKKNVLVMVEVHKRFDPVYVDARDRSFGLGAFSYMNAYMSQPKSQLSTFKSWAGKGSDISYYLNSHHIDFHEWCLSGLSRPIRVTASASTGVANGILDTDSCEDTIVLLVQWENRVGSLGSAVYTSSWIAPKAEVHSQQRFFYMGQHGEIRVDQAHRGFQVATDDAGFAECNPLFMKYTPNAEGEFSGQQGYGYRSIEAFVDAVAALNSGTKSIEQLKKELPTAETTLLTTAILDAGRKSLDNHCMPIKIIYEDMDDWSSPTRLELARP